MANLKQKLDAVFQAKGAPTKEKKVPFATLLANVDDLGINRAYKTEGYPNVIQ